MVSCSPIPASRRAGHQKIALSSASSMQSWPGSGSSLDFVPDDRGAPPTGSSKTPDPSGKSAEFLSPLFVLSTKGEHASRSLNPQPFLESHISNQLRRQSPQSDNLPSERSKRRARKQTHRRKLARGLYRQPCRLQQRNQNAGATPAISGSRRRPCRQAQFAFNGFGSDPAINISQSVP